MGCVKIAVPVTHKMVGWWSSQKITQKFSRIFITFRLHEPFVVFILSLRWGIKINESDWSFQKLVGSYVLIVY